MKVYIEDDHVFYCTLQLTCVYEVGKLWRQSWRFF